MDIFAKSVRSQAGLAAATRRRGEPSKGRMGFLRSPQAATRLALSLTFLMALADLPCGAQFGSPYPGVGGGIGFPGGGVGFPGGGGMGSPYPGGGRNRNGQNNQVMDTLNGKLQRISTSQLVLTTDDGTQANVFVDRGTRYYTPSGANAKFGDFDIGDLVSIDVSRDNQNYYHAVRMTLQEKGSSNQTSGNSTSDSDHPVLKRSSDSSSSSSSSSSISTDDPDRPRLTRNSSSTGSSSSDSATAAAPKPAPRDSDDPGPPVLRRNAPARVDDTPAAGSQGQTEATLRPSIKAEDMNGVTRAPAPPVVGPADASSVDRQAISRQTMPMGRSGDPVIEGAREAAYQFTESLPNYIVKQYTTRYQTDTAHGNRTSWQALDIVTADVVCENGKESYKNILINGKPSREDVEKTGSWSSGEFATVLQAILAPATDADFHGKRSTTIVNRPAFRYDYSVEKQNSQWHVYFSGSESYIPAYTGSIWIDKENFRVLRIEMSARDIPRSFPLDTVESAVDYDYVTISDQRYLLPSHSEALSCVRGTGECSRNVIEFRNYKKFGADTSITFDTPN
jgi:hypothetical protein